MESKPMETITPEQIETLDKLLSLPLDDEGYKILGEIFDEDE